MSHRTLLVLLFATLTSCGGSASETPWPAEPEGQTLGPAGETSPGNEIPVRESQLPDAGADPDVEP